MVGDEIRNLSFANSSRLNFAELGKLLPGAISPTDVDGAIEVRGEFFFIEGKRGNVSIPRGQMIFYEQLLSRLRSKTTIVFFAHDSSGPTVCPIRDCVGVKVVLWSEQSQHPVISNFSTKRHVGTELRDWLRWVNV